MQELRVGVLGLGQGMSHLRAFQMVNGSRVIAVCDINQELAARVAHENGIDTVCEAYEQLLENKEIDLVVVATPDHLHGSHVLQALDVGKHVLSEIPMATTLDECEQIIGVTDRTGLKYHMGNQVRYAFCLQDIHKLIAAGDLGEIFYAEGEYLHDMGDIINHRPPGNWRVQPEAPQTTLLGGGPHAIDTLRWLMGVRFVEVQAYHAEFQTEWKTLHTTSALFKADNGAVAKVTVSYGMVRPYCLYYSVYGTEGSFERTRDQGGAIQETTNYLYHSKLPGTKRMMPVSVPNWNNPQLQRQGMLGHGTMEIEQAMGFLHAIEHDEEPSLGPREAARSIAAGICALQSAQQGGGVVKIPTFD